MNELTEIFEDFGEFFKTKTIIVFTKTDSPKSSIAQFTQLLKDQSFFDSLITILETNARDD